MSVGLFDMHTGKPLPGRLTATVINFSPSGACLIVPKPALNGKHIFYETLNSDDYTLLLHVEQSEGADDTSTISARSVWMNSCKHLQQSAFKIGIHFLHDQKEIYNLFKKVH
ncbi:hypothetical protein FCL47_07680 [Desulfopila sp. IMCC35006]|uniref:hypothetical protein n=1 Tax=Desulfopila sp. IMCC35006 TaxID=2569542 RepID=UPI0010ABE26F|nr:hypothetical protein [Desulfopila sp. IMCC35006]TKB27051.1 hypothetical protein FCL47_07680 [Desulfopila sp. IMCC35006]